VVVPVGRTGRPGWERSAVWAGPTLSAQCRAGETGPTAPSGTAPPLASSDPDPDRATTCVAAAVGPGTSHPGRVGAPAALPPSHVPCR
jgi:hypothetical protein